MSTNLINLEYKVKGLDEVLQKEGSLEEKNKILVGTYSDINDAIRELGDVGTEASRKLISEFEQAGKKIENAINKSGSNGAKATLDYIKKANIDVQNELARAAEEDTKKTFENLKKGLENYTKQWQDNERKMANSQNSLLKGKKNTPIETSYLKKQQEILQGSIRDTIKELLRLKSTSNGIGKDIDSVIQHSSDAQNYTRSNIKQRAARDYLDQSRSKYDKLTKDYNKSLNDYGSNASGTKALKQELESITKERQKQYEILERETEIQVRLGNLTKEEGQDVINRQRELDKEAEARRKSLDGIERQKNAEKELTSLVKQKYQLENQIDNLSTNSKGKVSEVTKNQHRNELAVLKQQKLEIDKQIEAIKKKNKLGGEAVQKIKSQVQQEEKAKTLTEAHNRDLQNQGKLLSDTLKNFGKFTLYYMSLNALRQGIQKAIDTMQELDKAFTDIQIVTNGTKEETAELAKEYNDLAREMGSTTKDVAEGAGEWLRQGKTAEETSQLLKTSMTLSKVGAIESSQATELLTSSLNGYKIEVKDAMSVVDKMSAVDLAAATSTEELATALARTANIANDSNISFDKLIAMIGTVSSVTRRSAETIRRIIQNDILSYE